MTGRPLVPWKWLWIIYGWTLFRRNLDEIQLDVALESIRRHEMCEWVEIARPAGPGGGGGGGDMMSLKRKTTPTAPAG